MQVILLEKIKKIGNLGDKVNVKAGFGRNYLIPQGFAVPATAKNLESFEADRAAYEAKAADAMQIAQGRADELNKLTINIEALASDEGKLYGSVGIFELIKAFKNSGTDVKKREINLPEGPIHNVGEYEIQLVLHSDVTAMVKINVTAVK